MTRLSPFELMTTGFWGFAISGAYGVVSSTLIYIFEGKQATIDFVVAYIASFNVLITLGLIIGTSLIVLRSQNLIPEVIEKAFNEEELSKTKYDFYKQRFTSSRRSIEFVAEFVVFGFLIFAFCRFPLPFIAEGSMIIAACAQYGLGVYVGRKLCYAGMMLHSLLAATISRNLFKNRELDDINSYVHIASTLTIVFVYVHVRSYYGGPFTFSSVLGTSIKPLLLVPAIIATPVLLIFNFYARAVLRKLYNESIDLEIKRLQEVLRSEGMNSFEKRSYLIEFDKMSRDELRYNLQLSLSDLPIGITILIMILEPLIRR